MNINHRAWKKTVLIFCLFIFNPVYSQNFQSFINRINLLPESSRQAVVDSFILAQPRFPVTESDSLCHFIFTGSAQQLSMAGDATNWNPSQSLLHVSGTNFWYRSEVYESDARLDYTFIVNGSNWILDPRNPYTCAGGFGANSELRMPDYILPTEVIYNAGIAHGSVFDTNFFSTNLQNSRKIWVYTPPGYSPQQQYPSIYFHDGDGYLALASIKNVLDNLISENRIKPIIAVFIPPVNRTDEYAGSQQNAFTKFITEEVVSWVDGRFSTVKEASQRANMGASNGGNISLWLAVSHPEIFGLVAAQSSNIQNNITTTLQNGGFLNLKFYIDIGTYDIPILIPMVKNFKQQLENLGYQYVYHEFHEGHSWGNWKARQAEILEYFFGTGSGIIQTSHQKSLQIQFDSASNSILIQSLENLQAPFLLEIHNIQGQKLYSVSPELISQKILKAKIPENIHGINIVRITTKNQEASTKILLQ